MDTFVIWFVILWVLALIAIGVLVWFLKLVDYLQVKEFWNGKTKKKDR